MRERRRRGSCVSVLNTVFIIVVILFGVDWVEIGEVVGIKGKLRGSTTLLTHNIYFFKNVFFEI
jgi:hypothetical protein